MNNEQHSSTNRVPLTENAEFTFVACQPILSMCNATTASGAIAGPTAGGMFYQSNISYSGKEMNFAPDGDEQNQAKHAIRTSGFRQFRKLLRRAQASSMDAAREPEVSAWSATCSPVEKINVLSENNVALLERIARDERTPADVLAKLAQHPNSDLRSSLSDNKSTPAATIWALAKDNDPNVRYQLAENPHLPLEVLMTLRNDEHPYVACRAERTISRLQIAC